MKMKDFFYVCECGYTHQHSEMYTQRIWHKEQKKATQRKVCIEHGARITAIKTFCVDCGVAVITEGQYGKALRCSIHKTESKRGIQAKHLKKQAEIARQARLDAKPKKLLASNGCAMFLNVCQTCVYPVFPCAVRHAKRQKAAA